MLTYNSHTHSGNCALTDPSQPPTTALQSTEQRYCAFFIKKKGYVVNKLEGKEGDIYYLGRLLLLVWGFGIDGHMYSVTQRFIRPPPVYLLISLFFWTIIGPLRRG